MKDSSDSTARYPPYPYQKRRLYERQKEAFPVSALRKIVEREIETANLKEFREFQIRLKAHKLEKTKEEAKKPFSLCEDYFEAAFPDFWEEKEPLQPTRFGFEVEIIKPKTSYLPYWYEFWINPKIRQVKKGERRMVDYIRTYLLRLRVMKDHEKWLLVFLRAFLYSPAINKLDLIEVEIRGVTFLGESKTLSKHDLTKAPMRMPILGPAGLEESVWKKLEEVFRYPFLLQHLAEQLSARYPFAWCLTQRGEPIPRRRGLKLDSAEEIAQFFEKEKGVELYRSVDKKGIKKVDIVIIEYDPPLMMEDENLVWKQIVEDAERFLRILIDRGLNPKSAEVNFSGNKSLQILIHVNPPITYEETRDVQNFLACLHKFEAAKDSYIYTLDKNNGVARVTKILPDWTYGEKKEIKCVPVPNLKRALIRGDICCSIPIEFLIENDKIKFRPWVFNLNEVREQSRWEKVKKRLLEEDGQSPEKILFKPQSYYEKNATHPVVFKKLMEDFPWYVKAMKEIEPYQLDLWRKEWIRKRFGENKSDPDFISGHFL